MNFAKELVICKEDILGKDDLVLIRNGAWGRCTADLPDSSIFAVIFVNHCDEYLHESIIECKRWVTFYDYKCKENFEIMSEEECDRWLQIVRSKKGNQE